MKLNEIIEERICSKNKGLLFLGGRPAMGKTSFAVRIACEVSKNLKVAYITLEMSKDMWVDRAIRFGYITSRDELGNLDIIDETGVTVSNLEEICDKDYELIIIDYLQLIDREDGTVEEVQRKLWELSKKLSCPVLVVSQLSRAIDARESHIPTIEDLSLTQIDESLYDEIFLLYREAYYNEEADRDSLKVFMRNNVAELSWLEYINAIG